MSPSTATSNRELAEAWLRAFNAHDVDALIALYAENATHTSPKIRALHPDTGGRISGRAALATWWREANARLPGLRYESVAFTAEAERVFVEYIRHVPDHDPMPVAEVFDIRAGLVVASRVYHG